MYGYVYETSERKYELELKFDKNFPKILTKVIYHTNIKDLLGNFQLNTLINWTPESTVINIVHELRKAIEKALKLEKKLLVF